jgi:hypothetical protein
MMVTLHCVDELEQKPAILNGITIKRNEVSTDNFAARNLRECNARKCWSTLALLSGERRKTPNTDSPATFFITRNGFSY